MISRFPDDHGIDRLSYWDGDAYFYIDTPIKPDENKELYMWLIDKLLRIYMKDVSDAALKSFKEKIIIPEITKDKNYNYLNLDAHVFPKYIEVSSWTHCSMTGLYMHLKNNGNCGEFSKMVESMMLDFLPDDMDKIRAGIINYYKHINSDALESQTIPFDERDAFFHYA